MLLALAGCGPRGDATNMIDVGGQAARTDLGAGAPEWPVATPVGSTATASSVADPGPLTSKLLSADFLVIGNASLPARVREHVKDTRGVRAVTALSIASVPVADRSITVAAVDARSYRRYAAEQTAKVDEVWQAVAHGDLLVTHEVGKDFDQPLGGRLALRGQGGELPLRIGAYAATVPHIDAVVNDRRRDQLGMTRQNALLVSVDKANPAQVLDALRARVGKRGTVQPLRAAAPVEGTRQAAQLTGTAASSVLGSFSYRYFADGSVEPQADWVRANIRTESVPILGRVTCHRVMLPQLRAALAEIVHGGLAGAIDAADYGGCYVPRFIGHDPSKGLSLHTWGIALDLNVAGNQRGTAGEIDRRVVAIFKKWGFAWGGDWQWTDPMHFELAAIVR